MLFESLNSQQLAQQIQNLNGIYKFTFNLK